VPGQVVEAAPAPRARTSRPSTGTRRADQLLTERAQEVLQAAGRA